MEKNKKNRNNVKDVISGLLRGKSIYRSVFDGVIKNIEGLEATGLDIGSGKLAYYRNFANMKDSKLITANIVNKGDPDIVADAQVGLPFRDNIFDFVIAFNVLEHIFYYNGLFKEVFRILKPKCSFYATVPLLFPYHADPHDYFRFTGDALKKIGENAGFTVKVFPIGYGPLSVAFLMINRFFSRNVFLRIVGVFVALLCISLDTVISKFQPRYQRDYAFGHLIYAKKQVV